MELYTIGKEVHYGYRLPMHYNAEETFTDYSPDSECGRFNFTLISSGSVRLLINGQKTTVQAPAVLCLNETEAPQIIESIGCDAKSVNFIPSFINNKFDFVNIRDQFNNGFSITESQDSYLLYPFIHHNSDDFSIIYIDVETERAYHTLLCRISDCVGAQKDEFWPCRARSILLEILVLTTKLFEYKKDMDKGNPEYKNVVTDLITYIKLNYQNKIALNDLAKRFNTNRTTLNKLFMQETELSVIDYLIKYRVMVAATMLRDTMLPIEEIMERTGFNSATHFWRMFKRHTNLSPSQYRNQFCWIKD